MSGGIVGAPAPRLEDAKFLRGEGAYLDDIEVPGALHAVLLRSPVASCTIDSLDTAAARRLPGVRAVFTWQDLDGLAAQLPVQLPHAALTHARTPPALARDRISFVGQPVAMVVATDRYVGEDARDLIELDVSELPAVVDLETAAAPDSRLVHDDVPGNRAGRLQQRVGNPDGAFREAAVVVRERVTVERSAGMPLEGRGVVARFDDATGELTVWDSTQAPHAVRSSLASELGLPERAIRVIAPDTGGGFGTKVLLLYPEELLVPWAAMRLRAPVKWVEDRDEHFVGSSHERRQIHDIELAARSDGTVIGLRDHFLHDTGAFAYSLDVALVAAAQIAGPYRVPNVEVGFDSIYTNTVPVSPYRGCGRPQACAALELAMDSLAAAVGLDRMELRRRNLIGPHEFPYARDGLTFVDGLPVVLDSGDYPSLLEQTLRAIDYPAFLEEQRRARQAGRWIGLGLAVYVEATGPGPYEVARLDVDPASGAVLVSAGVATQGQSHRTTLAQVAADQLGVPLEQVQVVTGDTAAVARGAGTFASRTAVTAGNAVDVAAARVRAKVLRLASELLEVAEDDLELRDGRVVVRGAPARWLSLQEIAASADPLIGLIVEDPERQLAALPDPAALLAASDGPGLGADGHYAPPGATWAGGVHAAIVEIDSETCEVGWVRYVCTHDCGRMLNPIVVEGQVAGGVAQGVGGALLERMEYLPNGQLENRSFMDFLIPYATEVPHIEQQHLVTPAPGNALGVKGVGEAGAIPVPAVLVSAVRDALKPLGVTFAEAPLSPNLIHARLSAAGSTRSTSPDGKEDAWPTT